MDNIPEWIFKAARAEGENRLSFRNMLEQYIPKVGYSAPARPRILDIGCGHCYEAYVLSGYFGGEPFGNDSEKVNIIGIDIDPKKIETAKLHHRKIVTIDKHTEYIDKPNYNFILGDARKTSAFVGGKFDIAVARHPNIADIPMVWNEIFMETHEILKPRGILIGTSYSDIEHDMFLEQIERAGYSVILNKPNIYAIPTSYPEVSNDRHVLFAKKK